MSRSLTGGRPAREKEVNQIRKSTDCTEGKLIFTCLRERRAALLVNARGVAAIRVLRSDASKIGGIYLGKIQNVAKNIDACFVEILPGELCFLPLREAGAAYLTNRKADGTLKAGDELVVMVTRDAQKTKRASATADPARMKQLLCKNGSTPENASEALQSLLEQADHKVYFTCLLKPSEAVYEVLEQMADPSEYSEILTDDPQIYRQLSEGDHPLLKQKSIRFYDDPAISLRLLYSLERGMEEALDTRVWLKCGGYLVIEPTEAMTVIDVNSGKNEAKKAGEDTYYQVNLEAAEEVARQLRLRYHHCGLHQYGGKGMSEGVTGDIKESDRRGSPASPHRGYDAFRIGGDHPQKISSHAGRTIQEIIKLNASTHTDGPGIPIIAVSTKTLPEDIAAARNAGINEYLSKPLHPRALYRIMKNYL